MYPNQITTIEGAGYYPQATTKLFSWRYFEVLIVENKPQYLY